MVVLPSIASTAVPRAATPANISSGFHVAGISPYLDGDYLPSSVTRTDFYKEMNDNLWKFVNVEIEQVF